MAKRVGVVQKPNHTKQHMCTSIGNSTNTRLKNKQQRRMRKRRYRGQGK